MLSPYACEVSENGHSAGQRSPWGAELAVACLCTDGFELPISLAQLTI